MLEWEFSEYLFAVYIKSLNVFYGLYIFFRQLALPSSLNTIFILS